MTDNSTGMSNSHPEDREWVHNRDEEFWHMKDGDKDKRNTYSRVESSAVKLRGKTYLKDKKKYPSKKAAFSFICSKCFSTEHRMLHGAHNISSLRDYLSSDPDNEYLVINWLVPGHYTVVNLYVRTLKKGEDPAFDKLYEKFQQGDSKFRRSRFKFVPQVLSAPLGIKTLIKSLIGGARPVLIARRLDCHYFTGKNYMELDIDTGSSSVVSLLASSMVKSFKGIVANQAFLIEGRDETELPERLLAVHCHSHVSVDKIALKYDYTPQKHEDQEGEGSKSSYIDSLFGTGSARRSSKSKEKENECKAQENPDQTHSEPENDEDDSEPATDRSSRSSSSRSSSSEQRQS